MKLTGRDDSRFRNPSPPSPTSRSGATYSSRYRPSRTPRATSRLLFRRQRAVVAGRGHAVADQRVDLVLHQRDQRRHDDGEAVAAIAGAWKHSDLPPPVGSTSSESRPASTASIASRCSGRNEW